MKKHEIICGHFGIRATVTEFLRSEPQAAWVQTDWRPIRRRDNAGVHFAFISTLRTQALRGRTDETCFLQRNLLAVPQLFLSTKFAFALWLFLRTPFVCCSFTSQML